MTMTAEEFFALPVKPRPMLGGFPMPGVIREGEEYWTRGDGLRWRLTEADGEKCREVI